MFRISSFIEMIKMKKKNFHQNTLNAPNINGNNFQLSLSKKKKKTYQ